MYGVVAWLETGLRREDGQFQAVGGSRLKGHDDTGLGLWLTYIV